MSMAGLSRMSSMSFLYATPTTRIFEPRTERCCALRALVTFATQYSGISEFTSPATSMKRVR